MKSKTIIVFILLLAVGAGVVGLEKMGIFKSSTEQPNETVDQHLFIPTPKNPKQLTIEDMSGKKLMFIKNQGDGWEITHPIHGRVKPNSVEQIVSMLVDLQYIRQFDPLGSNGLDDTQTSLDKPGWIVNLYDDGGDTYTLFVGKQGPKIGASRGQTETYVRVKGSEKTSVVAEDLSALLSKDAKDFHREENLEPLRDTEIISLPGSILDYTAPASKSKTSEETPASRPGTTIEDSE